MSASSRAFYILPLGCNRCSPGVWASISVQMPRSVFRPYGASLDRCGRQPQIKWMIPTCNDSDRNLCWSPQADHMIVDDHPGEGCCNIRGKLLPIL